MRALERRASVLAYSIPRSRSVVHVFDGPCSMCLVRHCSPGWTLFPPYRHHPDASTPVCHVHMVPSGSRARVAFPSPLQGWALSPRSTDHDQLPTVVLCESGYLLAAFVLSCVYHRTRDPNSKKPASSATVRSPLSPSVSSCIRNENKDLSRTRWMTDLKRVFSGDWVFACLSMALPFKSSTPY